MLTEDLQVIVGKFTFRIKPGCLYAEPGVWVGWDEAAGVARIGLTDFRQQTAGDVAFVELPEPGVRVAAGDDVASIETIKVDMAVPSPLSGTVTAVNPALGAAPELINQDPYGAGWLVELTPDAWPPAGLLDAAAYRDLVQAQAAEEADR